MAKNKQIVSLCLGSSEVHENDKEVDVLKDLCAVKDYNLDQDESHF